MVDKVKVLIIERNGTELSYQEEGKPTSDYIEAKGISFESSDYLLEKIGRVLKETYPTHSFKYGYSGDDISYEEFYITTTQITTNRAMRGDFTYSGDNITSEAWKIYDTDGTTVLRTITLTHTYTGDDVTKTEAVES